MENLLRMWVAVPETGFIATELKLTAHESKSGAEDEAYLASDLGIGKYKPILVSELLAASEDWLFEFKIAVGRKLPRRPRKSKSLMFSTSALR